MLLELSFALMISLRGIKDIYLEFDGILIDIHDNPKKLMYFNFDESMSLTAVPHWVLHLSPTT